MPKKYRNLWVFGDSYTTPDVCVTPSNSFWMMTAQMLQVETVYNYSWPGNSLDSVVHVLISDSQQYDWNRDFFLIGIPPLVRLTVVSADTTKSYHRSVYDDAANKIDEQLILCHHGLENKPFYQDPIATRFEDPTWTEIQACRTIFLVNAWLDAQQADYFIINLSKDYGTDHPATGTFLLERCMTHPHNVINNGYWGINYGVNKPADFAQYGWSGHHGAVGNDYFFQQVLSHKIQKLGIC